MAHTWSRKRLALATAVAIVVGLGGGLLLWHSGPLGLEPSGPPTETPASLASDSPRVLKLGTVAAVAKSQAGKTVDEIGPLNSVAQGMDTGVDEDGCLTTLQGSTFVRDTRYLYCFAGMPDELRENRPVVYAAVDRANPTARPRFFLGYERESADTSVPPVLAVYYVQGKTTLLVSLMSNWTSLEAGNVRPAGTDAALLKQLSEMLTAFGAFYQFQVR